MKGLRGDQIYGADIDPQISDDVNNIYGGNGQQVDPQKQQQSLETVYNHFQPNPQELGAAAAQKDNPTPETINNVADQAARASGVKDKTPGFMKQVGEFWNGLDDDCDEQIDEVIDRLSYISWTPTNTDILLNATFDELNLSVTVDLTEEDKERLNLSIIWLRNSTTIYSGSNFTEPAWNCDNQTTELAGVLCNHTGFIGPWVISAVISDGVQDIYATWYVSYEVWHPPEPENPDGDETENSVFDFDVTTNQMIFLGLGVLITILLAMLILGKKKPPQAQQSMFANPRYEPRGSQYSAVPGAPVLPPPPEAFGKW